MFVFLHVCSDYWPGNRCTEPGSAMKIIIVVSRYLRRIRTPFFKPESMEWFVEDSTLSLTVASYDLTPPPPPIPSVNCTGSYDSEKALSSISNSVLYALQSLLRSLLIVGLPPFPPPIFEFSLFVNRDLFILNYFLSLLCTKTKWPGSRGECVVDSELIFPDPSPAPNLIPKLGEVIYRKGPGSKTLRRHFFILAEKSNSTTLSLNIA